LVREAGEHGPVFWSRRGQVFSPPISAQRRTFHR
jgi:hypothetical protein